MKNSENIILSKYGLVLALLIALLAGLSLLLGWLAFGLRAWVTFYNVLIVWIIVVVLIFYHTGKIKRDVYRFFGIFQAQDTVQRFDKERSDRFFRNLYSRMNGIIENLADIKTEKEKDNLFFRAVIDHADTGLMVYDETGRILLMNKAAGELLGKWKPEHIADTAIPEALKPGKKNLLKLERNGDVIHLSLRSTIIRSDLGNITLVSLQNIRQELEQNEVESWQKLIRVFIHEIMNSVSPITLTSTAILGILEKEDNNNPSPDIIEGLKAIRNRSRGISAFMDAYRRLSSTPVPDFRDVRAEKMINNVIGLMSADLQNRGIDVSVHIVPKDILIRCDEKLVEQVLINLIRNSAEALAGATTPGIRISCIILQGRIEIQVQDNGPGIDAETMGNIFVPFFSTKAEGTGIGLSLSRQIMNLHGGSIFVNSRKGNTVFTLSFSL